MRHATICVLAGLLITQFASTCLSDEKSDEWKLLDQRVGNWTVRMTVNPGSKVVTGKESCKWILNGRFLEIRSETDDGHKLLSLVLYDGDSGYHLWHFDKEGDVSDWKGKAADKGKVIEWTADLAEGSSIKGTWEYPDADTHVWKAAIMDRSGKTINEFVGKLTRKKQ